MRTLFTHIISEPVVITKIRSMDSEPSTVPKSSDMSLTSSITTKKKKKRSRAKKRSGLN